MIVDDLSDAELGRRLARAGLRLRTGPVVYVIHTTIPAVVAGIRLHYAWHPIEPDDVFGDFHVEVTRGFGLRRFVRRQAHFWFEGERSFEPLSFAQAFPMLEWGLNWCVTSHCHQYLMVHAAVLAREGRAVVLPAPPGSGKSTLCAALMLAGWRLLSDELALIDPVSGTLAPLPRPVSLKNASIDVIRCYSTAAVLGPLVRDTRKGTVAHLKPTAMSVAAADTPAQPAWLVFPRFQQDAPARIGELPRAEAFMRLVDNAFNYDVLGRSAFLAAAELVDACRAYDFSYSSLDDAISAFDSL
ncbi:MAG TPA: HprK-related kinase A [Casimicrobiaceae bacterium]|nr:HprK-related kinase A [Casimicrobiaceae bacterium]